MAFWYVRLEYCHNTIAFKCKNGKCWFADGLLSPAMFKSMGALCLPELLDDLCTACMRQSKLLHVAISTSLR